MRVLFLILFCIHFAHAQSPVTIIQSIKAINKGLADMACSTGKGQLISNRAMNLFLANKVGSYLSGGEDLSYYKNNITFRSVDGELTVNHSLFQASGKDVPITQFIVVGVKANILNAFAANSNGSHFTNELGFTVRKTWIGKTYTSFQKCEHVVNVDNKAVDQKYAMDVLRAIIIHDMEASISNKFNDFEKSLNALESDELPGQNLEQAKFLARSKFMTELQENASRQFAALQAAALIATNNYKSINTSWTSVSTYIPLIREKFLVAETYSDDFKNQFGYPASFSLSHTRFWENTSSGRLFFTISGRLLWNNSSHSESLEKVTLAEYRLHGGRDTNQLAQLSQHGAFIGPFNNFLTTGIAGKIVYIPPDWHFGVTLILEQNFGSFKVLNGVFGIPIVLITKNGEPSVNLEFQFRYYDISRSQQEQKSLSDKTSIGITLGIPFSKVVY